MASFVFIVCGHSTLCVPFPQHGHGLISAECFWLQVLDIVTASPEETGPLNLNIVNRKDLSSSWVREEGTHITRKSSSYQVTL